MSMCAEVDLKGKRGRLQSANGESSRGEEREAGLQNRRVEQLVRVRTGRTARGG